MQEKSLSFSQVVALVSAVGTKRTVLVRGENGIGKTALFHALRQRPEFVNHTASLIDCTQLSDGSVWMPDIDREAGVSRELPNVRFGVSKTNQKGVPGSRPSLIGLDEIMKVPQYIKNVLAPIYYEQRVGEHYLVEGSLVCCFTNLLAEGLGDLLPPNLRNRFIVVHMRKPNIDEWLKWAAANGIAEFVRAYVKATDGTMHSFLDYEPGGTYAGRDLRKDNPRIFNPKDGAQEGYVSPRSLHTASDIIHARSTMDDETLQAALVGALGPVGGAELSSFVRFESDIPEYGRVIKDPMGTALCTNPTAQIVQVMQFASRPLNRDEAEAVVKYVRRMSATMQTMFTSEVTNSSKVAMFMTVREFVALMNDNKVYL